MASTSTANINNRTFTVESPHSWFRNLRYHSMRPIITPLTKRFCTNGTPPAPAPLPHGQRNTAAAPPGIRTGSICANCSSVTSSRMFIEFLDQDIAQDDLQREHIGMVQVDQRIEVAVPVLI